MVPGIVVSLLTGLAGLAVGYVASCRSGCEVKKFVPWLGPSSDVRPASYAVSGAHGRQIEMRPDGDNLTWVFRVGTHEVHGTVNLRELFALARLAHHRVSVRNQVVSGDQVGWFAALAPMVMSLAQNKAIQDAGKKLVRSVQSRISRARRGDPAAKAALRQDLQDPAMHQLVRHVAETERGEDQVVSGCCNC